MLTWLAERLAKAFIMHWRFAFYFLWCVFSGRYIWDIFSLPRVEDLLFMIDSTLRRSSAAVNVASNMPEDSGLTSQKWHQ
ncbi:hypothetical protein PO002_39405 [Cupriavidus necator]|uniref:hypothetical protein n=1 Tax=Cupriavidus necator TaxID=106590 RepID=UPI0039C1CCCD